MVTTDVTCAGLFSYAYFLMWFILCFYLALIAVVSKTLKLIIFLKEIRQISCFKLFKNKTSILKSF